MQDHKITNAILLHGMPSRKEYLDPSVPSASNFHWFPWLQKQLLINNISAQTPEMFEAWRPDYRIWSKEFEKHEIGPNTILVGHSLGGGFLIQWLGQHKEVRAGKVILVAPGLEPCEDRKSEDRPIGGFFDFEIDPDIINRVKSLIIFNSDDDMKEVHRSVASIRQAIPQVGYREFTNYGHFCHSDLGTDAFPELLEEILKTSQEEAIQ